MKLQTLLAVFVGAFCLVLAFVGGLYVYRAPLLNCCTRTPSTCHP